MFRIKNLTVDRKITYAFSVSIIAILLLICFIAPQNARYIAAPLLSVAAVTAFVFIKKRNLLSIRRKEVILIMGVFAVLLIAIYFLTGLFFGYVQNARAFSPSVLVRYIIPIILIIITTEIIRSVLLTQKSSLSAARVYIGCVMSEVVIFFGLGHSVTFFRFMDFVGLTLFPALTANLLYNYVAVRYGTLPNIIYRLVTTLYVYIFSVLSAIPESLVAFAKLAIPLVLYLFLHAMYEKRVRKATKRPSKWRYAIAVVSVAFIVSFVMLISCQFQFGLLVIGSGSMTGEINRGDAIIYESYDGQTIDEGEVIVFEKDGVRTVHRVVDIKHINGVTRYYTKGDANDIIDPGYITSVNIIGVAELKIPYVGYPTLWMRGLFN